MLVLNSLMNNAGYGEAGFSPTTLGLVEAHGTGTPAGDFCEFTALNQVLTENKAEKQKIALGSVKSQIGHTKAAAGAASLIKATLALHHKVLPATINITEPNPKFEIEESAFYLNTETRPWLRRGDTPRRAGVSSFGFGGTDYHVVLEEYNPNSSQTGDRIHQRPQSIILWADNPQQLKEICQNHLEQLESKEAERHYNDLQNKSKLEKIPQQAARVGFVASSLEEGKKLLKAALKQIVAQPESESWEHPLGIYYRKMGLSLKGRVVALFPGQGSQYLNMGREIALNLPEMQGAYKALDDLMVKDSRPPLSEVVFPISAFSEAKKQQQNHSLQQTENAQPAIGAFSVGLYKTLQQAGFQADFVAGHSFGELTALWAGGVISEEDYYSLIKARGEAMATPSDKDDCDGGAMLAVRGNVANLEQLIKGIGKVQVANYNTPEQVVLSGSKPEIATLEKVLSKQGYKVTPLSVSAAFHTPFVLHASQPFADALNKVTFNPPKIPVYANMTGNPYPKDASAMRTLLEAHMLNAVQFVQEIENLYTQGGYCFVEIGPRQILTNLVKQTLGDRPHIAVALNPSRQKDSDVQLSQGVMQLRVMGLDLKDLEHSSIKPNAPARKRKGMAIQLNATNYVSPKTQATMASAFESVSPEPSPREVLEPVSVEQPQTVQSLVVTSTDEAPNLQGDEDNLITPEVSPFTNSQSNYQIVISEDQIVAMNNSALALISQLFQQFHQYQQGTFKVQEEYLKGQTENFQAFLNLLQQQVEPGTPLEEMPQAPQVPVVETPQPAPVAPQVPVVETPQPAPVAPQVPVVETPQPAPVAPQVPVVETPQPAPVAPQVPVVETPQPAPVAPEPQAEPTHISSIANYLEPSNLDPVPTQTVAEESSSETVEDNGLSEALLEVVSDKTGYPTEMLELDMDLEADLGIDSIKRVEIMGTLLESFPQLPKVSPEALGEQRTLAQIVQYLQEQMTTAEKKIA